MESEKFGECSKEGKKKGGEKAMVIGMEVKNKVQEMRNFANAAKKKYYRKEWRKSSSNWNGSER